MKPLNLELFVFVLVVEHEYGVDIWVHSTEEKAKESLEKYVLSWWSHEIDTMEWIDEPPPVGREEVIKKYFECVPHEAWRITKLNIDDDEEGGR